MKNYEAVGSMPKRFVGISCKDDTSLQKYLREIASYPVLSFEEERELAIKIKNGDLNAKRELIKANLRLAANVAFKIRHSNMTYSDLLQEANIGLMVAVDKYDYKLGYKFSTYATWWIKQAVLKAISEQAGCMKVPVYVQEIVAKYSKMKSALENELQVNLSVKDMAEKMEIEPDKLEEYVNAFKSNLSLDEKISEDSPNKEASLLDMLADETANTTAHAEYENLKEFIHSAVFSLKEREQKVVTLRFGLDNNDKKTLSEIGQILGVTKECIRQTEIKALKHLKCFCEAQDMELYSCQ